VGGLLRTLARLAFRRGVRGGSREWVFLSVAFGLLGWARKRAEAPPKVLHKESLGPGESICIEVFDPPR
jgi:hypothetical protein